MFRILHTYRLVFALALVVSGVGLLLPPLPPAANATLRAPQVQTSPESLLLRPIGGLEGRGCRSSRLQAKNPGPPLIDNGGSLAIWTNNIRVTRDSEDSLADHNMPNMVSDEAGTLYLTWLQQERAQFDVLFAYSTDKGRTWSAGVRVNSIAGAADIFAEPVIQVTGTGADATLSVAWVGFNRNGNADIYFARSTDLGASWSPALQVNDDPSGANQRTPSLAVDADGTIYVAWEDDRAAEPAIYSAFSQDGGRTWSASTLVNDIPEAAETPSLIVASDGTIYCAWCQRNGDSYEIAFARTTSERLMSVQNTPQDTLTDPIWTASTTVSASGVNAENPTLALSQAGDLYLAWTDYSAGNADVKIAYSADGGLNWAPGKRVNNDITQADQYIPSVTVDLSGTVSIAWLDERNGMPDIYFAKSRDNGQSWAFNERINDETGITTLRDTPTLAVDPDNFVYAAWGDTRNGSSDIYAAQYRPFSVFLPTVVRP